MYKLGDTLAITSDITASDEGEITVTTEQRPACAF
jgi:hypothetical protein